MNNTQLTRQQLIQSVIFLMHQLGITPNMIQLNGLTMQQLWTLDTALANQVNQMYNISAHNSAPKSATLGRGCNRKRKIGKGVINY